MSQQAPLVTVITPTYNHEFYLDRCVESVCAQTETRWEQIIVDDGSDDRTREIALGYDDSRIRYRGQDHAGIYHLAETLNGALASARGGLIAYLSGDDFWPEDKLSVQCRAFEDPNVVLSWGRAGVVDQGGNLTGHVPSKRVIRRSQGRTRGETFESLLRGNMIYAPTVMMRRDALLEIGGFQQPDEIPTEDWPTWLELSKHGKFVASDTVLGYYRRHSTQVTAVMPNEMARIFRWLETYVDQMSVTERQDLGIQASDLRDIIDTHSAVKTYQSAKQLLRDGEQEEAWLLLIEVVRGGGTALRSRALVALALTRLGVDVDRVATAIARFRRDSVLDRASTGARRRSRWRSG